MDWMEKAEMELEDDLAKGHITQKEFNEGIRDIQAEYRTTAAGCCTEGL